MHWGQVAVAALAISVMSVSRSHALVLYTSGYATRNNPLKCTFTFYPLQILVPANLFENQYTLLLLNAPRLKTGIALKINIK